MKTATQDLINEHNTITIGLNVIEKMSEKARKGKKLTIKT